MAATNRRLAIPALAGLLVFYWSTNDNGHTAAHCMSHTFRFVASSGPKYWSRLCHQQGAPTAAIPYAVTAAASTQKMTLMVFHVDPVIKILQSARA